MEPKPANIVALTVKNAKAALKDITKLNFRGYDYLYLASGFIAHYNLHGFIAYYQQEGNEAGKSGGKMLAQDIVNFHNTNQWNNFRAGERDYDYMMQKKAIYNEIHAEALRLYPHLKRNMSYAW